MFWPAWEGQKDARVGFHRVFQFPVPILIAFIGPVDTIVPVLAAAEITCLKLN
jgi:hypothetical protein